jgi:hypothetical protein
MVAPHAFCILLTCVSLFAEVDAVYASCVVPVGSLQSTVAPQNKSQLGLVLSSFPEGGVLMKAAVSKIVANGPDYIEPIIALVHTANEPQRRAIAQGLRAVAETCRAQYPYLVQVIPVKVMKSNISSLIRIYFESEYLTSDPTSNATTAPFASRKAPSRFGLPQRLDTPSEVAPNILTDPFAPKEIGY